MELMLLCSPPLFLLILHFANSIIPLLLSLCFDDSDIFSDDSILLSDDWVVFLDKSIVKSEDLV